MLNEPNVTKPGEKYDYCNESDWYLGYDKF